MEGERIAAVGPAAELAAAHPCAARVDLPGCVLAPGFVNLHAHIEYAAYSGLGDGLAFGPWIAAHTRRTWRLGHEGLDAMAQLGAAESLRSGVTTLVDAAYAGASVAACSAAGLRAIVASRPSGATTPTRPRSPRRSRSASTHSPSRRVRSSSSRSRPTRPSRSGCRSSPRWSSARERAACASSPTSASRGTSSTRWSAGRACSPARSRPMAVTRSSSWRSGRLPRPRDGRRARRARGGRGDRGTRGVGRGGRALPALERAPRLRHRPARAPARGRRPRGARHRQSVVGALAGHVRGAAGGPAAGARERRATGGALARRAPCGWPRSTGPSHSASATAARSRPACSPMSSRCGSTARPSGRATTRPRRSCWAAPRAS